MTALTPGPSPAAGEGGRARQRGGRSTGRVGPQAPLSRGGRGAGGEGSSGALFDATGAYRYRLWRVWDADLPRCAFVLLNPSTADAERDDPTLRRCIGFARAWGCGSVEVVNLFAFRATRPADLKRVGDPVGPENDRHVGEALAGAGRVVCGWGCHGSLLGRAAAFRAAGLLPASALCFGLTRAGEPRHPLYVRKDVAVVPWTEVPATKCTKPASAGSRSGVLQSAEADFVSFVAADSSDGAFGHREASSCA